jgi:hypothetical protein
MIKRLLVLSLLLLSQGTSALSTYPFHCRSLKTSELLTLEKAKQVALIIIENNSDNDVWLVNQSDGSGVDAGFDSQLLSETSAALLFNGQRTLSFQCIDSKDGSEQLYPCKDLINVCRATKFTLDPDLQGSFWAVESASKKELRFKLAKRGIEVE